VDIDRDMAVAGRLKVMSIPTLLILQNRREVARLDGLITEVDLRAAFERAARG
jgi:thioredoxin-like negative regulator of GroEL